jgi:hypothetical protein
MASSSIRFLKIYLNDHLAGSAGGVELARRLVSNNEGDATFGSPLRTLRDEIEVDRGALEQLMGELGVHRDRLKPAAAWAAEKLGRLKPNGQLTGYSPLSRLLELELLCLGITGKLQLWRELERTGPEVDGFDFARLAARAEDQRARVEGLHFQAASIAFPGKA